MVTNDRQRQKKLERRAAKRKERHRALIQEKNRGLAEQLSLASAAPILHCCATQSFWESGMSNVLFSRELPNRKVAFAMILIDRYCLGVKNAMGKVVARGEYDGMYRKLPEQSPIVPLPPSDLLKLVEDAIEYARRIGFEPHPDYQRVKAIFGDIDPSAATERYDFGGEGGKPHFIAGPSDNPLRCQEILHRLDDHCGRGGYHFTIPFDGIASDTDDDFECIEVDEDTAEQVRLPAE